MSRPKTPELESSHNSLLNTEVEIVLRNLKELLTIEKEQGLAACKKMINDMIEKKDTPEGKELLSRDFDDSYKIDEKETNQLLLRAIDFPCPLLAQALLLSGAASPNKDYDASLKTGISHTPLTAAIRKKLPEVIDTILAIKATSLDELSDYDETALMCAASLGEADVVQRLLGLGASPNVTNSLGITALIFAVDNIELGNSAETIRTLLIASADKNILTKSGHSAFDYSLQSQPLEIIEKLIISESDRKQYRLLSEQRKLGTLDLHHAAANGENAILEKLIRQRIRSKGFIDSQDLDGRTPLHYAAAHGHLETVKLLLEAGADTKMQDQYGRIPASYAKENSHLGVFNFLLAEVRGLTNLSSMESIGDPSRGKKNKKVTFTPSAQQLSPSASKYLSPKNN